MGVRLTSKIIYYQNFLGKSFRKVRPLENSKLPFSKLDKVVVSFFRLRVDHCSSFSFLNWGYLIGQRRESR